MPPAISAFSAYGIELEYMLVDRDTLDVQPIADRVLASMPVADPLIDCSNELVNHVIEIKNPRPSALSPLVSAFQNQVQQINRRLYDFDACLMPTAMHPWMDPMLETVLWPHDEEGIYATFDRLFNCNRHSWANVQSMHINLPFADDEQFEKLFAAIRMLLPVLPAIAASSPLANGVSTDYLDYRMHVYRDQSPSQPLIMGDVVPDIVRTREEHDSRILAPMYEALQDLEPEHKLRYEWLNARGAIPRFDRHAMEIRAMDTQECPQADIALAALVIDAVNLLYQGELASLQAQQTLPTAMLSRLLSACSRDAEHTMIEEGQFLSTWGFPGMRCTAHAFWAYLGETLQRHNALHTNLWQDHLQLILHQGPLSRRILRALGSQPSHTAIHAIYQRLSKNLHTGTLFLG